MLTKIFIICSFDHVIHHLLTTVCIGHVIGPSSWTP